MSKTNTAEPDATAQHYIGLLSAIIYNCHFGNVNFNDLLAKAKEAAPLDQPPIEMPAYRMAIVWGEDVCALSRYEFGTQAELNAFCEGLSAGDGFMDYHDPEDVRADKVMVGRLAKNLGYASAANARRKLSAAINWVKQGRQS